MTTGSKAALDLTEKVVKVCGVQREPITANVTAVGVLRWQVGGVGRK